MLMFYCLFELRYVAITKILTKANNEPDWVLSPSENQNGEQGEHEWKHGQSKDVDDALGG